MTLRQIIYDVFEHLNAYSDDIKLSEEHIAFVVNNKRNMLLKQYMSNLKKEIPQEAIQTVCMPLELDPNCFEGLEVLKSTTKIPPTLDNTGRSNIIKAYGGLRFTKNINIVDYSRIPFVGSEPYTSKQLYVSVDPRSYLIVFNTEGSHKVLEQLEIEGVFENPEEAYELRCDKPVSENSFETLEDPNCDFYDQQYPIESALISPMVMQIVQELLLKYQIPIDHINNAESDAKFEDVRFRRTN